MLQGVQVNVISYSGLGFSGVGIVCCGGLGVCGLGLCVACEEGGDVRGEGEEVVE